MTCIIRYLSDNFGLFFCSLLLLYAYSYKDSLVDCIDTDVPYRHYQTWLTSNPSASEECKAYTAKLTCLHFFFPCKNEEAYAPNMCSDVYMEHVDKCGVSVASNFYEVNFYLGNWYLNPDGVWGNQYNAMCFHKDLEVFDFPTNPCWETQWKCQKGTFAPECSHW
jgi:hypothetical protein